MAGGHEIQFFTQKFLIIINRVNKVIYGLLEHPIDLHQQAMSILLFSSDSKSVAITSASHEVEAALKDFNGSRKISISGLPGLGKTSIAKHIITKICSGK